MSGNHIEIPYKEKYYPGNYSLEITGISNGSNPSTPTITTDGFELSDVGKNIIIEKLKKEARNNKLDATIRALKNDIPYKALWIADAKNKNIPTQVAFERVGNYMRATVNEILRMVLYNLDKQYGKEWGANDSFSKKYIVPGLTYKCFTGSDKSFVESGDENDYYTYCHNTWLGSLGGKVFAETSNVTNTYEFNWDYIPVDVLDFENILNRNNTDVFRDPNYWDTTINEQQWDSFLKDYDTFKTTTETHVANKEIHLTPEEKAQLFKTKFVITSKPDLTGSQSTGNVAGFVLEPTSDVKTDKIVMKGISGLVSNILYIWKDTENGIITVL
jgi:hypothetical protein